MLPNVPALDSVRTIRVIYGPHGAPEYFTAPYIERFFDTEWEIHFNSSRTGVRLIGPKPEWAREDGGEAGLHPSNIHDNPYAVGAIDFTGDMPVILGPDGPSLGGFVCPVTIIEADLWHIGQLKAGDKVRFVPVDIDAAREAARQRRREIDTLTVEPNALPERSAPLTSPIVLDTGSGHERLVARVSGDTHLLLEIGPAELDLVSRFRGHALMQALEAQALAGVIDLTPGIRSLQVHYRPDDLPLARLLAIVAEAWQQVLLQRDLRVPSRVVHLPLSWDDPACRLAIEKYMTTVRKDAPWCPSNLEFIRRINDLDSIDAVKRIVFDASYLVMGLGDVYLGAPVATPLDPRHRLVTTKYNPARTWTAENSVGIGGAYLCVYGMEGPGGYQFVGRTLQMWNRYRKVADFAGSTSCCASSIRFASTKSRQTSCFASARIFRWAVIRCASSKRSCRCRTIRRFSRKNPRASTLSARGNRQRSTRSANAGAKRARPRTRWMRRPSKKRHSPRSKTAKSPWTARSRAASGK